MAKIKRLLVANRGEIAVRILAAARELSIHAVAIYSPSDTSHISHASSAVALPSASSFTDVAHLVALCKTHHVDAVHPGYGFLSESAAFASALQAAGIGFVGPSADILRATGDKLSARRLALDAGVPVLPALTEPTQDVQRVADFAHEVGWPVMLKAVDGGGGRGIRLVRREDELEAAFRRASAESSSGSIFAEKALVDGCRHVEVQILGDGDTVCHFWERECSLQRRYQKVVEIAPSTLRNGRDDTLVESVIQAAMEIAKHIRYQSLGTFEFLVSPSTKEYYFMEINPRLQVEHTITETICNIDLVALQLLVASGQSRGLVQERSHEAAAPNNTSMQLRVAAEDPRSDFALAIGRINTAVFPAGNGVRVDTHVRNGTTISTDFDSLLAKIIVTGSSLSHATAKGLRALADMTIEGVTTNADLLAGILLSGSFAAAQCDTRWLEQHLKPAVEAGAKYLRSIRKPTDGLQPQSAPPKSSSSELTIKKGDRWNVSIASQGASSSTKQTLQISKIMRNDIPHDFAAELVGANGSSFNVRLSQADATQAGVGATNKQQADSRNPTHLSCPLSGTLVEMLVDEGDVVKEFDSIAVIRQMKMELEVRAHRKGVVSWIWDVDDGEDVQSGMLVCTIVDDVPQSKM